MREAPERRLAVPYAIASRAKSDPIVGSVSINLRQAAHGRPWIEPLRVPDDGAEGRP